MNNEQALQRIDQRQIDRPLSIEDVTGQVNLIQQVMRSVMKQDEHYGVIPGCGTKPTLLQPGAQKLLVTFRLAPEYAITERQHDKGHREYQVICTLKTIASGSFVGQGAGSASTLEGKWRYRVAPKKLTDRPVPKQYWELRQSDPAKAQELLGGKGFSTKKDDNGQWMITEGTSDKVEHDNPADYYNTVLKMACKRALVAATLTATAASDIFTQDIEEMVEVIPGAAEKPAQTSQPETTKAPPQSLFKDPPPARPPNQPDIAPVDGEVVSECVLESFKRVESKPGAAKPWTAWFCKFKDEQGEFEAGTFSKTVGDSLEVLQGQQVKLVHRAGKKEGSREIVTIEPNDDILP